jgi:hypothetical protein
MVAAPQPEPLRKRLFRYAGLVVSGIVVGALATTLASADTFGNGPPTEGYISDSSVHTYCFGSGFNSDLEFHAQYAMGTSLDAATQMSDQFEACSSATDVRWLDANLPGGTRGQYICTNLGAVCFASDITLDPAEIDVGANDSQDRSKTACHEVGHSAVGLQHGSAKTDCMINGEIPGTTQQWRSFNAHHIGHINDTFP